MYLYSGLGRLNQAEEYLAQAQWTVLKTPECSNAIKSKLYRNLGLLYAAKGEYDEALRQLADDVSRSIFSIINVHIFYTKSECCKGDQIYHMFSLYFRFMQHFIIHLCEN